MTTHSQDARILNAQRWLNIAADALGGSRWRLYVGSLTWNAGRPGWQWITCWESEGPCGSDREGQEPPPDQQYPRTLARLAERFGREPSAAEAILRHKPIRADSGAQPNSEPADEQSSNALAWLKIDEPAYVYCGHFSRQAGTAHFTRRDARVLHVLVRELVLPALHTLTCTSLGGGHAGAAGTAGKLDAGLFDAGHAQSARQPALSPRQHEVLVRLMAGYSVKQVASQLGLSHHTVNDYVREIYKRFGVSSRGELMAVVHGTRTVPA